MRTFLLHFFPPSLQHRCHYWRETCKIDQRHRTWLEMSIIPSVKFTEVLIMSTSMYMCVCLYIYIYRNYESMLPPMCYIKHQRTPSRILLLSRYRWKSGERWVKQCRLGAVFPWRKLHLYIYFTFAPHLKFCIAHMQSASDPSKKENNKQPHYARCQQ